MSKKLSNIFQPNVFMDFGEGKIFSNKFAEGFAPPPRKGNQIWMQKESGEGYEPIDAGVPCVGVELGGDNPNNIKLNIQDIYGVYQYGKIVHWHNEAMNEEFDRPIKMPIYMKSEDSPIGPDTATNMRTCIVAMPQLGDVSHDGIVYSKGKKVVNGERFSVAVGGFGYDRGTSKYVSDIGDMAVLLCADPRRFQPKAYIDGFKTDIGYISGFYPTDAEINDENYDPKTPHYYFMFDGHKTEYIWLALGSFIQLNTVIEVDDETGNEVTYWEVEDNHEMIPMSFDKGAKGKIAFDLKLHMIHGEDNVGPTHEYDLDFSETYMDLPYQTRAKDFGDEWAWMSFNKYHTDGKPWQWGAYIS